MKNSKLIKLLRLFDSAETKQLRKFVLKMSSDEALPKLFEFLIKQTPKFEYEKEQCYQAVYPDRSYSDVTLRKVFANGIKITEQFIISKQVQKSDLLKNRLLTEFYQEKEATSLWEKQLTSWEKANQKTEWNHHFLEKIRMAEYQFRYQSIQKDKKVTYKRKKVQLDALTNMLVVLEQFIVRYMFCYKSISISSNDKFNKSPDFNLVILDQVTAALSNLDQTTINQYQESHSAFYSAWKTYELLSTKNHDLYTELKQYLYKNHQTFPFENKLDVTTQLTHYSFHFYEKAGQFDRWNPVETFELFVFVLEQKLCYKGKYLLPMAYLSLFNLAFDCGKLEWIKTFIDTYSKDLPPYEQFHLVNYCNALYHFGLQEFSMTIEHLELLEKNKSHHYNLDAKIRLLMAYYEVEHDRFEVYMNSLRVALFRDRKHIDRRVEGFKQCISFLHQIHNCPKGDKENLPPLILKIRMADPLEKRDWLLDKIEDKLGKRIPKNQVTTQNTKK